MYEIVLMPAEMVFHTYECDNTIIVLTPRRNILQAAKNHSLQKNMVMTG